MRAGTPFTADVESRKGVVKIALSGELDMATAAILDEHLRRSEEGGATAIILDLRNVTFMDCTSLDVCLLARDRAAANGHRFMIIEPSRGAKLLFELTGTQFLIEEARALEPSTDGLAGADASTVGNRGPDA